MRLIQFKEYNEIIKEEENFNKDITYKDCNYFLEKLNQHRQLLLQLKGAFLILIIVVNSFCKPNDTLLFLKPFEKYVNECKHARKLQRTKIFSEHPYISVCLAALNMRLYMQQNLLSIINQSFQDFEIIVVNDFSRDETEDIILNLQASDSRIKLVNHYQNLAV